MCSSMYRRYQYEVCLSIVFRITITIKKRVQNAIVKVWLCVFMLPFDCVSMLQNIIRSCFKFHSIKKSIENPSSASVHVKWKKAANDSYGYYKCIDSICMLYVYLQICCCCYSMNGSIQYFNSLLTFSVCTKYYNSQNLKTIYYDAEYWINLFT